MSLVFWNLIIGLGVFIFGMHQLEKGISALSATQLKKWISGSTRKPIYSVGTGVITTAVLQSSSMVSLLVLAFASAGMLPLVNAIGVILGANLGTTATGWVVATIGFKMDLELFALPLFGLGGLVFVIFDKDEKAQSIARVSLGLGLLLFGLIQMKDSVSELPNHLDISVLKGYNIFVYFLVGAALTAVIQSSSAAMMITLAAVNSELIDLYYAMAFVIGADLGTTSTTILGSLKGHPVKRRLAFSHFMFNLIVDLAALWLLLPVFPLMLDIFGLEDPLYGLVAFHSVTNLAGLFLFVPLIHKYSAWIEQRFITEDKEYFLVDVPAEVPDAALEALKTELLIFWYQAIRSRLEIFSMNYHQLDLNEEEKLGFHSLPENHDSRTAYEQLKRTETDILRFSHKIQKQALNENQSALLSSLLEITRAITYSSKTIKDIQQDLEFISESSEGHLQTLMKHYHENEVEFFSRLVPLLCNAHPESFVKEEIEKLIHANKEHHRNLDELIYQSAQSRDVMNNLSAILNSNREIHHANKVILKVVDDWQRLYESDDAGKEGK